jgi:phosphoketolase
MSTNATYVSLSPDETYSNKLDAVFEVTKPRVCAPYQRMGSSDMARDGRVIEMLSEHSTPRT